MLILGVHPGYHDATAVLTDDYKLRAAVQLERLTRRKIDGGRIPDEAIDECLSIAGASRSDVDVVVLGRRGGVACHVEIDQDRGLAS